MRARVTRPDELSGGPTLFEGLHTVAIRHVPARLYLGLQFAAPAAVQLWTLGWKRGALSMATASLFGIWALFEQKLDQAGDTEMGDPAPSAAFRIAHGATGLVAGVAAFALLLEGFVRFMAFAFGCAGCAG